MIQPSWRRLRFHKEQGWHGDIAPAPLIDVWARANYDRRAARKLAIALWRLLITREPVEGVIFRQRPEMGLPERPYHSTPCGARADFSADCRIDDPRWRQALFEGALMPSERRCPTPGASPGTAPGTSAAMQVHPYRWRVSWSFVAHLLKATTQQHHRALGPMIARLLPSNAVVFDVGAHAGQYTKLFARAAAHGKVYAFEPGSYARSILRVVVWVRGLSNVAVVPIALGSEARLNTLTIPLKRSGTFGFGLSHLGKPSPRWVAVSQEIVATATIDGIVGALDLDRLDFVKADIEGWELRLLYGAERSLERFRPRLLLELAGAALACAGDRLDDAFAFLTTRGYRAFRFGPEARLTPVAGPEDGDFWFLPAEDPVIEATPAPAMRFHDATSPLSRYSRRH